MYVEVQTENGGFAIAFVEDERENVMFVRFLEKNANDDFFSFKTPVWISKGKIISTYPVNNYSIKKLGYEQVNGNKFRELEITSDEEYIPEEDDEEEDEEEHLN